MHTPLVALLFCLSAPPQAPAPRPAATALDRAMNELERALADATDPAERGKLSAAIGALHRVAAPEEETGRKALLAFLAKPGDYKDKIVTFRVNYSITNGGTGFGAGPRPKQARFWVAGRDHLNLNGENPPTFMVDVPPWVLFPQIRPGDDVLLTFRCGGELGKGNTALEVIPLDRGERNWGGGGW